MVRVGVVGCGTWGGELVRAFQGSVRSRMVVVCDAVAERLERFRIQEAPIATTTNWEDVVRHDGVDLVVIATPASLHFDIARDAIRGGKHVLVEPPFTAKSELAEELVERADHGGVRLAVDYTSIFHPAMRAVKELMAGAELGDLGFIDAFGASLGPVDRTTTVMRDLAAYDLAIIEYLTGRKPNGVLATGSCHSDDGKVDVAFINLDYGDGLMANLHANRLTPFRAHRLMVGGTRKLAAVDDTLACDALRIFDNPTAESASLDLALARMMNRVGDIRSPSLPCDDAVTRMTKHVLAAIEVDANLVIDGRLGLNVSRILDSCERSLHEDAGQILKSSTALATTVLSSAGHDSFDVTPRVPIPRSHGIDEGRAVSVRSAR